MKTQTGTSKIAIIFTSFVIILVGMYFVLPKNKKVATDFPPPVVDIPSTAEKPGDKVDEVKQVADSIFPDVLALLQKNNIDLSKLRSTSISIQSNDLKVDFKYDSVKTGYTFVSTPRTATDELGITHAWFDVYYKSLPVFTTQLGIHFSKDRITANDVELADIKVSMVPKISKSDAMKIIESSQKTLKGVSPILGFSDKNAGTGDDVKDFTLIWKTPGRGAVVEVDAFTGEVLYSFDGLQTAR